MYGSGRQHSWSLSKIVRESPMLLILEFGVTLCSECFKFKTVFISDLKFKKKKKYLKKSQQEVETCTDNGSSSPWPYNRKRNSYTLISLIAPMVNKQEKIFKEQENLQCCSLRR